MSRNDNRRGNRNHGWNAKDRNERNGNGKNEQNERERDSRSSKNDRKSRNSGFERSERFDRNDRNEKRSERRGEQKKSFSGKVNFTEIQDNEKAIRAFKENAPVCEICGQPISDISSAISNKENGNPVHFDCVLNKIAESEKPGPSEKIAYIGQGRFAVIYFENPRDTKHFTIRKTIEWEGREQERGSWRNEMAGLYSQVK